MKFCIKNNLQISSTDKTNTPTPQPPTGEGRDSPAARKDLPPMEVSLTTPTQVFEDMESQLKPMGVYILFENEYSQPQPL